MFGKLNRRFSDLKQIYTIFRILCGRLSGGSIVGSIAPYQAFAIGGPNSVRGYGEGAVGSGQSCLVSKTELAIPLVIMFITLHVLQ
jgi:outer membrane protein assembly factor BamA